VSVPSWLAANTARPSGVATTSGLSSSPWSRVQPGVGVASAELQQPPGRGAIEPSAGTSNTSTASPPPNWYCDAA
jgi:hypothetical protein